MTDVHADDPVAELKERHRAVWNAGDWPGMARHVHRVSERCVQAAGIRPGERVLDVGCGTGPATFLAAARGARATGIDLAPKNIDVARERAAATGGEVEFLVGDAEALPFEDGSFHVVMSAIGAMFAPRHEAVADELARVLRPGGRLAMCNWTPDWATGRMFALNAEYMPAPPEFASSPILWGDEDHVRRLLEPRGFELDFDRDVNVMDFDTPEALLEMMERDFGPAIVLRSLAEPQGLYDGYRERFLANAREFARTRGRGDLVQEFLVVSGTRAG